MSLTSLFDSTIPHTGYTFLHLPWSCRALSYTFGMLHVRRIFSSLSPAPRLISLGTSSSRGTGGIRCPDTFICIPWGGYRELDHISVSFSSRLSPSPVCVCFFTSGQREPMWCDDTGELTMAVRRCGVASTSHPFLTLFPLSTGTTWTSSQERQVGLHRRCFWCQRPRARSASSIHMRVRIRDETPGPCLWLALALTMTKRPSIFRAARRGYPASDLASIPEY